MHRRVVAAVLAAIVPSFAVQGACAASNDLPLIDHVVVVVLENHSFDQIVDPHRAPFIHHLATDGALIRQCLRGLSSEPAKLLRTVQRVDPGHKRQQGPHVR